MSPVESTRSSVRIAIVGRPNVGKSTLFNRLIGSRTAIVSPLRGTTRDWICGRTRWRDRAVTLIDTGGVEFAPATAVSEAVQGQIRRALQQADGVLFVCDAREGVVPADEELMARLRRLGKPLVVAVNKMDDQTVVPPEFYRLGVAHLYPISALHGRGIGELLDHLVAGSGVRAADDDRERAAPMGRDGRPGVLAVAIVGRANVGKSSLLNALLREDRVAVTEVPGTTRDAIDSSLIVNGRSVVLIDTAGLRHRRKVKSPVDLFAMARALDAIERCDVALVLFDATQGVTQDDRRIVSRVLAVGRGLVLLLNKWDLVRGTNQRRLAEAMRQTLPVTACAPVLACSAKTGFHVTQALATALRIGGVMQQGLPDAACQQFIEQAWSAHVPPRYRGRPVRLLHARCLPGRPMRVELATAPAGWLPVPFQRYLLKRLQGQPHLAGVPLRLSIEGAGTPRRVSDPWQHWRGRPVRR